jgi:hypothetical protein
MMHTDGEDKMSYKIEGSTEWGAGIGPNGTGKRKMVCGFYVVSPEGRKVRAFTGMNAEADAGKWAAFCNENLLK